MHFHNGWVWNQAHFFLFFSVNTHFIMVTDNLYNIYAFSSIYLYIIHLIHTKPELSTILHRFVHNSSRMELGYSLMLHSIHNFIHKCTDFNTWITLYACGLHNQFYWNLSIFYGKKVNGTWVPFFMLLTLYLSHMLFTNQKT